ncbi:glutaredoxin family protein [Paucibacter sp. AS339]|uniref:glutaredoxin family protein n=1 Tax=Paucibacter hankyongi TaxID=3133434 RepID=UPI00309EA8CF
MSTGPLADGAKSAAPSALSKFWPLLLIVLLLSLLTQGAQYWRGEQQGQVLRGLARPGDIVMLSNRSCVFCARARSWLDEQRIPYRECFIESDADCAAMYRAQLAPGTPTFVLRGQHRVVGFDKERISELLARP